MSKEVEAAAAVAGGGILVWFSKALWGKRRAKVDMLRVEVSAMQEIVKSWKDLAEGLRLRVGELERLVDEMHTENIALKVEVSRLEKIVNKMRR